MPGLDTVNCDLLPVEAFEFEDNVKIFTNRFRKIFLSVRLGSRSKRAARQKNELWLTLACS
jgi:hypothetical protein